MWVGASSSRTWFRLFAPGINPKHAVAPVEDTMNESQRNRLMRQIQEALPQALLGSLSETYRRCGNPNCRCHHGGPKHGPHLYVSYRGPQGKTTGYYVPEA